jgi:hypothetical protein
MVQRVASAVRRRGVGIDHRERFELAAAEGVLDVWQGLVAGRWSLVDLFQRDGERHVVACSNDPFGPEVQQLSGARAPGALVRRRRASARAHRVRARLGVFERDDASLARGQGALREGRGCAYSPSGARCSNRRRCDAATDRCDLKSR